MLAEPLFVDHREPLDPDELQDRQFRATCSYATNAQNNRSICEQITNTYRDVWQEFYAWEPDCCQQLISALARPVLSGQSATDDDAILEACWVHGVDDMTVDDDLDPSFSVYDFVELRPQSTTIPSEIANCGIKPHPKYEACAPSAQNLKSDHDADNGLEYVPLRFVQYAGEPGFNEVEYAQLHKKFVWQIGWYDNDVDVIAFEAARRLTDTNGLSHNDIDQRAILVPLLSSDEWNRTGLVWRMKQRDPLFWPGYHASKACTPALSRFIDVWKHVNENTQLFCPNLNCTEVLCATHGLYGDSLDITQPHVKSLDMRATKHQPCGSDCFLVAEHDNDNDIVSLPDKSEQKLYTSVLNLLPDSLPCHLAKLCRVPCYKVFNHRCILLADENIVPEESNYGEAPTKFYDDTPGFHLHFTPISFCHHPGPCGPSNCLCYQKQIHCRKNCKCSHKCKLRYKGCKCKRQCSEKTCKCIKARRECDPELCSLKKGKSKNIARTVPQHQCQNQKIHHGQHVQTEIKTALFGLGTFATKDISPKQLVGEYIAEIRPNYKIEAMMCATSFIQNYVDLNYAFDLNQTQLLDGAFVGNETRYINHRPPSEVNVEARVLYVNGEYRIGLYAIKKIKKGREIFLNYGENYWPQNSDASDSSV